MSKLWVNILQAPFKIQNWCPYVISVIGWDLPLCFHQDEWTGAGIAWEAVMQSQFLILLKLTDICP